MATPSFEIMELVMNTNRVDEVSYVLKPVGFPGNGFESKESATANIDKYADKNREYVILEVFKKE